MKNKNNRICIVGSGVLGSYATNLYLSLGYEVDLYEIGNSSIKNEEEIGFTSQINTDYTGTKNGRFFGYGGTSEMWGGQILFFEEKDFKDPDPFTLELVKLNRKYAEIVSDRLRINHIKEDDEIKSTLGVEKKGFWLNPRKRNLFKFFRLDKRKNIRLFPEHALTGFKAEDKKIIELYFRVNTKEKIVSGYDTYIIAIGAIEHARLIMRMNNLKETRLKDHLSIKLANIISNGLLINHDLKFKITSDRSLVTKRIIGEIDNKSYFLHPIFNDQVPLFKFLKFLLFKKQFETKLFIQSFKDFRKSINFIFQITALKKFVVFHNHWSLQLDFESESSLKLELDEKLLDRYNLPSFKISGDIDSKKNIINQLEEKISRLFEKNEVHGNLLLDSIQMIKPEDTYHPYDLITYNTFSEYFNEFQNGIVISTAIMPRIGGINPTASLLPIIEYYAKTHLQE